MNIFSWLIDCLLGRVKAASLYKRGMTRAKKHDHQGALEDYTATIEMPGTSADLLAMVLYNRALVYVALGDERKGLADLDSVLAMSEALVNIKTMARQKRAKVELRASKCSES